MPDSQRRRERERAQSRRGQEQVPENGGTEVSLGHGKGMAVWDSWGPSALIKIPQGSEPGMEAAESLTRKRSHPLGK